MYRYFKPNKDNMNLLYNNNRIVDNKFTFSNRQTISCLIQIYNNVKFEKEVSFGTKYITQNITYHMMIAKPSSRLYFLLSDRIEPIIGIGCFIKGNHASMMSDDFILVKKYMLENIDLKSIYNFIRGNYCTPFIGYYKPNLERYLTKSIVSIVIDYSEYWSLN